MNFLVLLFIAVGFNSFVNASECNNKFDPLNIAVAERFHQDKYSAFFINISREQIQKAQKVKINVLNSKASSSKSPGEEIVFGNVKKIMKNSRGDLETITMDIIEPTPGVKSIRASNIHQVSVLANFRKLSPLEVSMLAPTMYIAIAYIPEGQAKNKNNIIYVTGSIRKLPSNNSNAIVFSNGHTVRLSDFIDAIYIFESLI